MISLNPLLADRLGGPRIIFDQSSTQIRTTLLKFVIANKKKISYEFQIGDLETRGSKQSHLQPRYWLN